MAAYIARRLIWVVFLLFVITLITFVIFSVLPAGDPAVARAGRQPSPELVENIRAAARARQVQAGAVHQLHRRPPAVRRRQRHLLRVQLHRTTPTCCPRSSSGSPTTLFLTAGAVILWLSIGIPIGVLSAVKTGSWMDRARDGHRADLHLRPGLLPRPRRPLPVRRQHRQVPDPARQLGLRRRATASRGRRRR